MRLKKICVSTIFVYTGLFVLLMLVGLAGYGIHDYRAARKQASRAVALAHKVSSQQTKIIQQQNHIRQFASDINELRSELVALNQFEEKIRVIADIQDSDRPEGFFGIGGFIPEDLKPGSTTPEKADLDPLFLRRMHARIHELETVAGEQETSFETLFQYLENQKSVLNCTPSIRPAKGWISSGFGYRTNPFTGRREMHKGLDIANHKGTPIIAPAQGVVTYVGRKGLLGNIVEINHGHGFVTRYGHISKAFTKKGQNVKRGEKIAQIGSTGRSTGPHLHYEIRLNGIQVNPRKYILN